LFKKLFKAIGSVGSFLLRKLTGKQGKELELYLMDSARAEAQKLLVKFINKNPQTPKYAEMLSFGYNVGLDLSNELGINMAKVNTIVSNVISELDRTYNFQK
jgi:hypothetical protein